MEQTPEQIQEQLKRRNDLIQRLMAMFDIGYASACQFYYALRNYRGV